MKKKYFSGWSFERIVFPRIYFTILIVNFLSIAAIFLIKTHLPPEIPLFYGKPFGQDQLVKSSFLTIPLIITTIIAIFNLIISIFVTNRFLTQMLAGIATATSILALITVFEIIYLVGNF